MNRRYTLGGLVVWAFLLIFAPAAMAMPSGAESATSELKSTFDDIFHTEDWLPFPIGFGATGDFVIDRNLDDDTDLEAGWYGGNIYVDPFHNIEPFNRVHLNVFLGVADFQLGNVGVNTPTTTKVELDTDTDFAAGAGGKVDIVDFPLASNFSWFSKEPPARLFAAGGFRWSDTSVESATTLGTRVPTLNMDFEVMEWSAGVGLSQRFNNLVSGIGFVPYVGVHYSEIQVDVSGTGTYPASGVNDPTQTINTGTPMSDDSVAVFVGCQVWGFEDRLVVSVEGRFIAESSVSVNGRIRW